MKKSLVALAALSAFAGVASAQSSVTLSGSVDAGVRRVGVVTKSAAGVDNGTASDWRVTGSQSGYNAFTISGIEDLGGGTRAIFALNHRFVLGNGTINGTSNAAAAAGTPGAATAVPFWRNAYVGLGGGFGEIRIGRYLMPLQDYNGNFDPFGTGTVGSVHTGGIAATIRANNQFGYRSPSLGGFSVLISGATAEAQVTEEMGSGSPQGYNQHGATFGTQRPVGAGARYKAGPVDVALAYDRNVSDEKTIGVYAAFDMGVVKLMGQFEKGDNYTTATAAGLPEEIKAFSLGLTAPLGPVLLRTGFLKIKSDRANRDASKFGFGGDYNLSKRTNLYTTVGKWSGNRLGASGSFAATAAKKAQFDFGITHRF